MIIIRHEVLDKFLFYVIIGLNMEEKEEVENWCRCKICLSAKHSLDPHLPIDNPKLGRCGNGTEWRLVGKKWVLIMRDGKPVHDIRILDRNLSAA
jgi:hypothetical protein